MPDGEHRRPVRRPRGRRDPRPVPRQQRLRLPPPLRRPAPPGPALGRGGSPLWLRPESSRWRDGTPGGHGREAARAPTTRAGAGAGGSSSAATATTSALRRPAVRPRRRCVAVRARRIDAAAVPGHGRPAERARRGAGAPTPTRLERHAPRRPRRGAGAHRDGRGGGARESPPTELDAVAHDSYVAPRRLPEHARLQGLPKSICTSVNEVVCHGIPDDRAPRRTATSSTST